LRLVDRYQLCPHLYADDTQIYDSCHPSAASQLQERVSACVDEVALWMRSNRLQLNASKTEVLCCASSRRQHQIPRIPVRVCSDSIQHASSVRDLGVYLDGDASMRTHVFRTVSNCFAVLRQIRSIRRSLTRPVLQSLVVLLIMPRLDYGNVTLAGLPDNQLSRLQSMLNAAARLVFSARKQEAVSPLLHDLHWLRVPQRIDFKLAVLTYRCLHSTAPPYLADELHSVADIDPRRRLKSESTPTLVVPSTRHSTIGNRAFLVAASCVWNSLPSSVTSSTSLTVFRQRLKTELFL